MTVATVDTRLQYMERQIVSLEKDVDANSRLSAKFDLTLDKIGEATASIKEMLAVHDSVLRRQYDTDLDLYRAIDDHKKENLIQHKEMMVQYEKAIEAVVEKIERCENNHETKFVETAGASLEHDRRIRGLERITFIGLGLAMLIGILADKLPLENLF